MAEERKNDGILAYELEVIAGILKMGESIGNVDASRKSIAAILDEAAHRLRTHN